MDVDEFGSSLPRFSCDSFEKLPTGVKDFARGDVLCDIHAFLQGPTSSSARLQPPDIPGRSRRVPPPCAKSGRALPPASLRLEFRIPAVSEAGAFQSEDELAGFRCNRAES